MCPCTQNMWPSFFGRQVFILWLSSKSKYILICRISIRDALLYWFHSDPNHITLNMIACHDLSRPSHSASSSVNLATSQWLRVTSKSWIEISSHQLKPNLLNSCLFFVACFLASFAYYNDYYWSKSLWQCIMPPTKPESLRFAWMYSTKSLSSQPVTVDSDCSATWICFTAVSKVTESSNTIM